MTFIISHKTNLFTTYSVVCDECTDIRGINDRFKVTEEFLSLCSMFSKLTYIECIETAVMMLVSSVAPNKFQFESPALQYVGLTGARLQYLKSTNEFNCFSKPRVK